MKEPARIAELVRLALLGLVAFGYAISEAQIAAVVALVGYVSYAAVSWGITEWVRRRVTPTASPTLTAGTVTIVTDAAGAPTHTTTLR